MRIGNQTMMYASVVRDDMQKIEYEYNDNFMDIEVKVGPEQFIEINGVEFMMLINKIQLLLSTAQSFEVKIKSKEPEEEE